MDRADLEKRLPDFVGKQIGPPEEGPDPVNEPMIRHWCEAMGDTNPVYLDAEAARASIHGGLVAPPTMLQVWIMRGLSRSGSRAPRNLLTELLELFEEAGFDSIVATNCEQEYDRYLRPGERIIATEVIESISEHKTTALGPGYFIHTRITLRTPDGERVGTQLFRLLRFKRPEQTPGDAPAMEKPKRLRPVIGHDNRFFWEGVERAELLLQRCSSCRQLRHPPRPMCPHCQSLEWETLRSTGRGTIYSYVITHHPPIPPFEYPFATVLIELEEGVKFVSSLLDIGPEQVAIGMPVEVVFHEVEEGFTLPLFRPAS